MASPPVPAQAAPDRRTILSAIRGRLTAAPVPLGYRLALAGVAVAMVLLPLVYLAFVGTAAYATWWHAVHNITWLAGKGSAKGRMFVYATPLVGGLVTIFFMIKPLLARHAANERRVVLDRRKEPFLYDFVDRLCRTVGAPVPLRIEVDCEVNASAQRVGFGRNGGLVLTIGLPLAAGLTMRQMSGVLAHEFGHFAQGAGMRLSGVIRRVNHWFARVVYERDAWDERLDRAAREEGSGGIIIRIARFLVWLSRRLLQLLMVLGHVISCALMRQMEHDADRYEALVAGSDTFAATARRLRILGAAHGVSHAQLAQTWREGRLPADLPGFVAARAAALPPDVAKEIEGEVDQQQTGWFDTHPCDGERIERTARLRSAGLFQLEAPATALFRDFAGLSRQVSLEHYREIAGDTVREENLVPNDALIESAGERQEARAAFARLTQGLVDVDHLVFPPSGLTGATAEAAGTMAREARARFDAELPNAREAFGRLEGATARAINVGVAEQLIGAGLPLDAKAFHLPAATADGAQRAAARFAAEADGARAALGPWAQALRCRLAAGLARLGSPESEQTVAAMAALQCGESQLLPLRVSLTTLSTLLDNVGEKPDPKVAQAIRTASDRTRASLEQLAGALGDALYPFEHAGAPPSLARHVVPEAPAADDLEAVFGTAREALDRYVTVYVGLLGRLALAVEGVEGEAGLSPLAVPAGDPD